MHDAAGVPGLVAADSSLGLQHAEARPGAPGQQLARDRQAEDAAADDGQVAFAWGLGIRNRWHVLSPHLATTVL